ncbi:MAG: M20 family metallo-hydrolase [Ginsengibacter sp.]
MKHYLQRANKVLGRINELAGFSDDSQYISRIYGTEAFIHCGHKIASWMQEAGLETRIDNIGNIRGLLRSKNPNAKTFVIASHFDTVVNAGKFDGLLGIAIGIDLAEVIKEKDALLPFHIEIIAFSEQEGIRFSTSYIGSQVVAGGFKNKWLEIKDREGFTLSQVLRSLNYNTEKIKEDAILPDEWMGYLEIHIEQGAVLYEKGTPLGIVNIIAGHKKIDITFTGESGHAGTVPMNKRRDALCAAAKFITSVEKYASKEKRNTVATVGQISVPDSAPNKIPGTVSCTLDLRSSDAQLLSEAYENINNLCEKVCDKRDIYFEWKLIQETDPVICNKKLRKLLSNSLTEKSLEPVDLISWSAHDAAIISHVAPVVMLFVKCFKGISHDPLENVEINDIASALEVSDHFMNQLIAQEKTLKKNK